MDQAIVSDSLNVLVRDHFANLFVRASRIFFVLASRKHDHSSLPRVFWEIFAKAVVADDLICQHVGLRLTVESAEDAQIKGSTAFTGGNHIRDLVFKIL
jgi:hypothetical protein